MHETITAGVFALALLAACGDDDASGDGGTTTASDAASADASGTGTSDGGTIGDQFIRADLTLGDGREVAYEAPTALILNQCSALIGEGSPAGFNLAIRWDDGVTPRTGRHTTGDDQGVDVVLIWPAEGGNAGGGVNLGPPGTMGPGGIVTFTDVGDVVAGTFEGSRDTGGEDEAIAEIENGEFRCVL